MARACIRFIRANRLHSELSLPIPGGEVLDAGMNKNVQYFGRRRHGDSLDRFWATPTASSRSQASPVAVPNRVATNGIIQPSVISPVWPRIDPPATTITPR